MKKDFDKWHTEKSDLHANKVRPFFHEREIWFCSLGTNIGFEQDGADNKFLRPIIVLKKFNNEVLWCIPLTKRQKNGKHYFQFKFSSNEISTAILSQLKLIDSKRLQYKVGGMKEADFRELKAKLKQFLA